MADGTIASLDGGLLARSGRTDVPCLRESWAESVRTDSPGAIRRIDTADAGAHPAAIVALDLHHALSVGDADSAWMLSSEATRRKVGSRDMVLDAWRAGLGDIFSPQTGIASGVYDLRPYSAVGVRIVDDVAPVPEVATQPTPVRAAGAFVIIEEAGTFRADLPLSSSGVNWVKFMATAPEGG